MFQLIFEHRDTLFTEGGILYKLANLFGYTTVRAGGATLLAFGLSLLFGHRVIAMLVRLKLGQPIRGADEVHKLSELHEKKAGTPTMGGVLMLGCVVVSVLLFGDLSSLILWSILGVTLSLGALGFYDDYLKVAKKNSKGISARTKLAGQILVALAAGCVLSFSPSTGEYVRQFWVPGIDRPLIADLHWFTPLVFVLVVVGTSNAVNLTDGLDGLAAGCTVPVAFTFGLIAHLTSHAYIGRDYLFLPYHVEASEVAVICLAMAGAAMGFLWFNCYPASVFMGDTGSLAIGGLIGMVALCLNQELLLVIVGGVFVMEAVSVLLQVGSFKLRGKRIFRMAPIHHHFELKGWKESKVIVRFWTLGILFALLGLATLKIRV